MATGSILNKFICYQTDQAFQLDLTAGYISEKSIVFVLDKQYIYSHGRYFNCDFTPEVQRTIAGAINKLDDELSEVEDTFGESISDILKRIAKIENDAALGSDLETLRQLVETKAPISRGVEFIKGTQTSSTNAFLGVTTDQELYDGKVIAYWLPQAPTSSNATLNLTLAGGSTTGALSVYFDGSTRLSNQYTANNLIFMVYISSRNAWNCHAAQDISELKTTVENITYLMNNNDIYYTS